MPNSIQPEEVPAIDPNAPLKIEEAEEKEENEPQEKSNKKLFILGGVMLGIIVIVTVSLLIFSASQSVQKETKKVQTETTPGFTQTPKPVLKKEEWTLEVLNGSGVSGVAKKIADKLTAFGYLVVKTGNADKNNYSESKIFVKKELLDKVDLVIADLKDIVKIASVAGELKEGTASARIIIGKE